MPTPARRDGRERREALLDAALLCFARHGVIATGIEEIRKEAGASPSSVYHLFEGLEGVTLALLVRTFERLFAELGRHVTATRTARDAVYALVEGHLAWTFDHRDEARVMYQLMSLELGAGVTAPLKKRKAELLEPVVAHLASFVARGTLPRWSPLELEVALLGSTHEACRRFLAGAPLDANWMRATLPRLAWAAVVTALRQPKDRRPKAT